LAVAAVLVVVAGLAYRESPPFRAPDRVGKVEAVTRDGQGRTSIRLRFADPPPADPAAAANDLGEWSRQQAGIVHIHLPPEAAIRRWWFRPAELRAGQRVRVWCDEFVMTSYPPQQIGRRLEIVADE